MRGDLSDVTAADACRLLAGKGADGALLLEGPDGPGSIVFEGGRIVAATSPSRGARLGDRLVGAGYLDEDALGRALDEQRSDPAGRRLGAVLVDGGYVPQHAVRLFVQEQVLDALFEIVRWRYGSFEYSTDAPTVIPEVGIALSVDEALIETARRQREWEELSQVIPDLDAVPVFATGATSASAGLEADEFAVLASIDGQRTIRELADDLGYGEFEAARIVYALTLLGIVEIELPEDEIGAALEDALLGAPWDTDPLLHTPAEQVAAWERDAPTDTDDAPSDTRSSEEAATDEADAPSTEHAATDEADAPHEADAGHGGDAEPAHAAGGEPGHTADVAHGGDAPPAAEGDTPAAADEDGPAPWEFFPEPSSGPSSQLPPPTAPPGTPDAPPSPSEPATPPAADHQAPGQPDTWPDAPAADAPQPPAGDDPHPPAWDEPQPHAGDEPQPPTGDEPPTAPPPITIEAELPGPSFSDIIGELHRIGDGSPPPQPPDAPTAPEAPAVADAPADADQHAQPAPAPTPSDPVAPPSGDVHEFLRELSRLALDEDVDLPAKPPTRRDEPGDDDSDDAKRKRRGIFGWGG